MTDRQPRDKLFGWFCVLIISLLIIYVWFFL